MTALALISTVDQAMVRVEAAYVALTRAVDFQETRKIKNAAIAAAALAREAKDDRLLAKATELRTRAERKVGQMLTEAAVKGERTTQKTSKRTDLVVGRDKVNTPTLPDLGITRDQSSKWQAAGKLTDAEFEQAVEVTKTVTANISTAAVMKLASTSAKSKQIAGPDSAVAMLKALPEPSDTQHVANVFDAVRVLAGILPSAARLMKALPYYQHEAMMKSLGPAIKLLQEMSKCK